MIKRREGRNIPRIVSDTVNEGVGVAEGFGEEVVSINDEGFSSRSLSALSLSLLPFPTSSPPQTPGLFFFPLFPLLAFRLMAVAPAPFSTSPSASLSSLSSAALAEGRGI